MSSLLPSNSTAAERALAEAMAGLSDVPIVMRELWNADTIPYQALPWLAWAMSVDEWDVSWSEEQKRAVVKSALAVQRIKGTIGAVRKGLAALGIDVRVQEWFAQIPQGEPGTFKLWLTARQTPVNQAGIAAALAVVQSTKNLRSHLDEILISAASEARLHAGAASCIGSEITLSRYTSGLLVINELALVLE